MAISIIPTPSTAADGASAYVSVGAVTNTTAANNVGLAGTDYTATFLISTNVSLPVGIYTVSGLTGNSSVSLGGSNKATSSSNVFNVTTAATSFYYFAGTIWATGNTTNVGTAGTNQALAYGNGKYISMNNGGGTPRSCWSTDGITWTSTTNGISPRFANNDSSYVIRYLNSLWFAGYQNTGSGQIISTSTDGLTWVSRTTPVPVNSGCNDIAYGNGAYVAVGYMPTGTNVIWSTDGATWTTRTTLVSAGTELNAITYGPSGFVTTWNSGISNIFVSTDGITWTTRNVGQAARRVYYANNQYLAIDDSLGTSVSTDTVTWTVKSSRVPNGSGAGYNFGNQIHYDDGYYVAVGAATNEVHVSTDGSNWTLKSVGLSSPNCVTYGTKWVTVTQYFRSATSTKASGAVLNAQGVLWERKGTVNQTV